MAWGLSSQGEAPAKLSGPDSCSGSTGFAAPLLIERLSGVHIEREVVPVSETGA